MNYPKIDLNKYRTEEVVSIFSSEGVFSDGRPYIIECWAEEGCTMETIFTPAIGFDIYDEWSVDAYWIKMPDELLQFFLNEGYTKSYFSKGVSVRFFGGEDRILSINVLIGVDE